MPNAPIYINGSISKPSGGLYEWMRPAEKHPAWISAIAEIKILKLGSLNAQRRFFKNKLGQVTQQRKCKHRKPQPRQGQE
jgi:hypothetical protein